MARNCYFWILRVPSKCFFLLKYLVLDLMFDFDANKERGALANATVEFFANFLKMGGKSSLRHAYLIK